MFTTFIATAAGMGVLMFLVNRGAFSRIFGAGRAQVGKFGRAVEGMDPLAIYNQRIEDASKHLGDMIKAQKGAKTNLIMIERQVAQGEAEHTKLTNRVRAADAKGDTQRALSYARELASLEKTLETNRAQYVAQKAACEKFDNDILRNQKKIIELRQEANRLGLELKTSAAQAAVAQQFRELTSVDLFDGTDSARQKLQEQIDANRASANVDQSISVDDDDDTEDLRAQDILASIRGGNQPLLQKPEEQIRLTVRNDAVSQQ